MSSEKAVFVDRDGVICRTSVRNGRPYAPIALEDFVLLPGVAGALERLRLAGFRVIVVTNQPDVAAGRQRREVVEEMHARLAAAVSVDDVLVCYHDDREGCECRKPRPGMLCDAAKVWQLDLSRCYMVGDRWRDISAGLAVGCTTVLVGDGYKEAGAVEPHFKVSSLDEASRLIVAHAPSDEGERMTTWSR